MNTNRALQSTVRIALSMLIFILITCSLCFGGLTGGSNPFTANAAATVSTGKTVGVGTDNTTVYSEDSADMKKLYQKTNEGTTVCSFTSTPSLSASGNNGSRSYMVYDSASDTSSERTVSFTYGSLLLPGSSSAPDSFSSTDETLIIGGDYSSKELVCTFGLSETLRKALKDRMLSVTMVPYVITHTSTDILNNLPSDVKDAETADIDLFFHSEYSKSGSTVKENKRLKTRGFRALPVADSFVLGSESDQIEPNTYLDTSYLQVTVRFSAETNGTFAVAIKEIGIRVSVTFNRKLVVATGSDNLPSTDPAQLNKITTCIVEGTGRYAGAPADYAKGGDILNVNLVLKDDGSTFDLDTASYEDSNGNYSMNLDNIPISSIKDGTVFRYFFLRTNDYLINWEIDAGSVDEGATESVSSNKSGQAIKFVVSAGEPISSENNPGLLVLRPVISYRDRLTGDPQATNSQRPLTIKIHVDDYAPNVPTLDRTTNYYNTYIDEDFSTYYTEVQPALLEGETDAANNVIRLKITASDHPAFTDEALDLMGGSNMIIYYKTSYIGDKVPTTTAAKNAASFYGPTYIEETTGVFIAYEGRLEDSTKKLYKMGASGLTTGDPISAVYYVRNNVGKYVRTTDSYAQQGISYYRLQEYAYENVGEYTGVYARTDEQKTEYGDIYLNLVTSQGTLKAGVWAIEFIAFDYVGKSTLCSVKSFVKADITDYRFAIQFYMGNEATSAIDIDNFGIFIRTISTAGDASTDTVEIESDTEGEEKIEYVRLRRANKLLISVSFSGRAMYEQYKFVEFSAGNVNIVTKDYTYDNEYYMTMNYASFTPYGKTREVSYTMEIDASFCNDPNLRIFKFRFKEIVTVNPANKSTIEKTYTGSSLGIDNNVNVPQQPSLRNNVRITYYYHRGGADVMDSVYDDNKVAVGSNASNVPVDAGTYVYYAEIADHTLYYGLSVGTLIIEQSTPSVETACENLRVNYREKATVNGKQKTGLAILDFDPDDRDWLDRQVPANGLSAAIVSDGRTYFLTTMSSDKVPGYYQIISPLSSSAVYLSPNAGDMTVTIRFVPVEVEQAVSGTSVSYKYDANGNFIRDYNYKTVDFTRTLTVVHDTNVKFNVDDDQGDGTVRTTTMVATGEIKQLKYVTYTYNGNNRSIAYTLTAGEEINEATGELVDLKRYAVVSYCPVDSLTLTLQQLNALTFSETAPLRAGLYAVRIRLNEAMRGCNYSTTQYAYIRIDKIPLTVDVDSYVGEYQYEEYPEVALWLNSVTFPVGNIEGLNYEFFYFQYDKPTAEERTASEFAVKTADLRRYVGTPIKAGDYYVKVTVVDDNYSGTGYAKYTVRRVDTDNGYFSPDWPRINNNPMDYQSNITAGQPLSEVLLDTGKRFTYAYREIAANGSNSFSSREVLGTTYVVLQKYDVWYADKMAERLGLVKTGEYYDSATGIIDGTFEEYGKYVPLMRELYDLFTMYFRAKTEEALLAEDEEGANAWLLLNESLAAKLTETRHTDTALAKSAAFVAFYLSLTGTDVDLTGFLDELKSRLTLNGETDALAEVGLTDGYVPATVVASLEETFAEYLAVNADYELLHAMIDLVVMQGLNVIRLDTSLAREAEILLQLRERVAGGHPFFTDNAEDLNALLDDVYDLVGATETEWKLRYIDEMQKVVLPYKATPYVLYLCFFAKTEENGVVIPEENFDFVYETVSVYVGKAYVDWTQVSVEDRTYSGRIDWNETLVDLDLSPEFLDMLGFIVREMQAKAGKDYFDALVRRLKEYVTEGVYFLNSNMVSLTLEDRNGSYAMYVSAQFGDRSEKEYLIRENLTRTEMETTLRAFGVWNAYAEGRYDESSGTVNGATVRRYDFGGENVAFKSAAILTVLSQVPWLWDRDEHYVEFLRENGYVWDLPQDGIDFSEEGSALISSVLALLPANVLLSPEGVFDTFYRNDNATALYGEYTNYLEKKDEYVAVAYMTFYKAFAAAFGESALTGANFHPIDEYYGVTDPEEALALFRFGVDVLEGYGYTDDQTEPEYEMLVRMDEVVNEYASTGFALYVTRLNNRYAFYLLQESDSTRYLLAEDLSYDDACDFVRRLGNEYAIEFIGSTFVTQQISPRQTATVQYGMMEGTTLRKAVAYSLLLNEFRSGTYATRLMIITAEAALNSDASNYSELIVLRSWADSMAAFKDEWEDRARRLDVLTEEYLEAKTAYAAKYDELYDSLPNGSLALEYIQAMGFNEYGKVPLSDNMPEDADENKHYDYFELAKLTTNFAEHAYLTVSDEEGGYRMDYLAELLAAQERCAAVGNEFFLRVSKANSLYSIDLLNGNDVVCNLYDGLTSYRTTEVLTRLGATYAMAFDQSGLASSAMVRGSTQPIALHIDTVLGKTVALYYYVYPLLLDEYVGAALSDFKAEMVYMLSALLGKTGAEVLNGSEWEDATVMSALLSSNAFPNEYDAFLNALEKEKEYAGTFCPYYADFLSKTMENNVKSYFRWKKFTPEDLAGKESEWYARLLNAFDLLRIAKDTSDVRNLYVTKRLGVLYSTKGVIPTDGSEYYIRNNAVYKYVTVPYYYRVTDTEPTITGASSTQINLVAVFDDNDYRETYQGARVFRVVKREVEIFADASDFTDRTDDKDYAVYGVYDEDAYYKTIKDADGNERKVITYGEVVEGDESRTDGFRGSFTYVKNGVPYNEPVLSAGTYVVTYTLENDDYSGTCSFTLIIKPSALTLATQPQVVASNVVYGVRIRDNTSFYGGAFRTASGGELGITGGQYVLSGYEVKEGDAFVTRSLTSTTLFPNAGTQIRLYFNFIPTDGTNYTAFYGTTANRGYVTVTVGQADVSDKMSVSTKKTSYVYKEIYNTDERIRENVVYTISSELSGLANVITLTSSRGGTPARNAYLNADEYTLTVSIEDENYCGSVSCVLLIEKKAAYIELNDTATGAVVTKNGLTGIKKVYRGGSQTLDLTVREYEGNVAVSEGTTVVYRQNNVTITGSPTAIGYYDAYVSIPNSVNYRLVDKTTGREINTLHAFLIIGVDLTGVEITNLEQVYTIPKTVTVFLGANTATYTLSYEGEDGATYKELPTNAGTYDVFLNFAAEDNNGYEEKISALDIKDNNGVSRGYKLVIDRYPADITAPGTVSATYTGKEGEKFSPYTSPYGMTLNYSFRVHGGTDDYVATTARALGAFEAGEYDVRLEIDNPNYRGNVVVLYSVAQARLTERSVPEFAPYAYNDENGPEYVGGGSFAFGSVAVEGRFVIDLASVNTLSVGDYTVAYTFIPDSPNYREGTGTTKLKIVKRVLDPTTLFIGSNGEILTTQDYTVEYNNATQPLTVRFDPSVIYNYPASNSDFTVSVRYTLGGATQTPLSLGSYTVKAEVMSKNYSCEREWTYKYVITKATPVIEKAPTVTRTLVLNETVDTSVITGGRAVLRSAKREQIYGAFSVETVTLAEANEFLLPVTFTPGDGDLYNTVRFTIPVNVVGYDSLFIGSQKNVVSGVTASGSDWTDQVINFSTNVRFRTRGVTLQEGEHGAVVKITPISGVTAQYGATLADFRVAFVPAEEGCEDCQAVVEKLNRYGVLSFARPASYVPDVGEEIEVVYKLIVDSVEDALLYNDMTGTIDVSDVLVRKTLTNASRFDAFLFEDGGNETVTKNALVNVTDDAGRTLFTVELDDAGNATVAGTPGPVTITMTKEGDNVRLTLTTGNYEANDLLVAIQAYTRIDAWDINIERTEKAYDGKPLSVSDLGVTIRNTQLGVSESAVRLETEDGSAGTDVGVYTVKVIVNDRENRYYGWRDVTFEVKRRDVGDAISLLLKEEETLSGETYYVDSYASATYLTVIVGVDGERLEEDEYEVFVKEEGTSDATYARITSFNAGKYVLRVVVSTEGYYGEGYFLYHVYPQEITMRSGVESPYVVEYGSSEYASYTNSVLQLSYRDPNGYAFNFDTYGGVTVYYSATGYPKQTAIPTNAGTYVVTVESNNGNYVIANDTMLYTIRPRRISVTGTPTLLSVNEAGDNLIYGYTLSDLKWVTTDVEVLDPNGNAVEGRFTVSSQDANRVPFAGKETVTLTFVPDNRNYDVATVTVQVTIGKKVLRLEFESLTANYDGTNKRNELRYKSVETEIVFRFINAYGQQTEPVNAGQYTLEASATNANYTVDLSKNVSGETQANPTFTVYKATVNEDRAIAPRGEEIGVGESLEKSTLTGGRAYYKGFTEPISGEFTYTEKGRAFNEAGVVTVEYRFTPTDSANFATYKGEIEITIGRGRATVAAGENTFTYGSPADFSLLTFETLPAGLQSAIRYDLTYNGTTYRSGDIIPSGTYYFTCYVDDDNYVSDPITFRYTVEKKKIDIDFINESGEVVTVYSSPYGTTPYVGVRMYDANYIDKNTYLLKDEASIGNNVEYRYVSRGGETAAYDSPSKPTALGSYDLTVTLRHDDYEATNTVIYRVTTGTVTSITFDEETLVKQTYGSVVEPIITTTPANVGYYVIYQGHGTNLPTEVGTYTLTVYIDDGNFASKQVSGTFRINPKPLTITDITVKDKAYDGVPTIEISGRPEGVLFGDEVLLEMKAETFDRDPSIGEHYVTITSCVLKGLHSGNYDLTYPTYDGKVRIYTNLVNAKQGNSYMISNEGFAEGTDLTVYQVDTTRNQTSVWSRMLGVEASVYAYSITVNNASGTNTTQYKICIEIPEEYRDVDFKVEFAGALEGQTVTYDVEGNYIAFYSTSTSGEVVFSNAKFRYTYVVTAAILLIIIIAVVVLLILNPFSSRRALSDPRAAKNAVRRIRRGF